ncbi:MAG: shikimate dehydrogenase [Moraxellaceae bacterium]|nr:MAG: shikimate dehydrogenase [Moraxellaceae bacterium]
MTITGKTRILALIGDPVAQAKTPACINQLLVEQAKQDDYVLVPMHVSSGNLDAVISGLRHMQNFCGAVITMPHKVAICALLDELTPEAKAVGAVNVIYRDQFGKLHGHILDGEGFIAGLLAAEYRVQGSHCLMRGAGGAASAIAFALARHGCQSLRIDNRSRQKAEFLKDQLVLAYPEFKVTVGETGENLIDVPLSQANAAAFQEGFDIAINASSLGMQSQDELPFPSNIIKQCALVAECVIAPEQTALLQLANRLGIKTHTGLNMLNSQLALMLDFMTQQSPK